MRQSFFPTGSLAVPGFSAPLVSRTTYVLVRFFRTSDYIVFNADGKLEKLAWTKANSTNAWLVLDRTGNVTIDDGTELFGNFSPQPKSREPNGFIALAEFDRRDAGGNGNGQIDQEDVVFGSLLLWRDENHNGVSEPNELQGLRSAGIKAIDLHYAESRRRDSSGNRFRFRSKILMDDEARTGIWAVDVFLARAQ